jgi:S1-C subfamily serine protease
MRLASVIWTSAPHSRRDIWHLNSPAIQSYEKLAAYLSSKLGEPIAALFAIPSRQGDGSISWTDRLGAEQTTSLKELTGEEKDRASAALKESLQKVETACDGSPEGQLLLGALTIENPDAIRVANGRPIIAGWGAVPASLTTPEQLSNHHLATLGPFLSRIEPPRFWITSVDTVAPDGRLYGSRALLAAVLLAVIVLAWLLLPGVLRNNSYFGTLPEADFSGSNRSIERQIDTVKRSLESNICIATSLPRLEAPTGPVTPRVDGSSTPPIGGTTPIPPTAGTPKGDSAPGIGRPTEPGAVQPPPTPPTSPSGRSATPGSTTAPGDAGAAPATPPLPGRSPGPSGQNDSVPPQESAFAPPTPPVDPNSSPVPPQVNPGAGGTPVLATLLKKSTVIIVTGAGTGSGFFVSRDHILTNKHVTEDSANQFMVGNKALARMLPADLVGTSDTARIGAPDFALLKLRSGSSDSFLSFSDSLPFELQNVIATGYPGFIIKEDDSYRRMMGGDVRSVPETALTIGGVTYIQNAASQSPIILHYATISPGNSGGPLTDECGRVVGINTFVRSDEGANARMNYALAASSAIRFLKRFNITPTIVPGRCTTAVAGNPPPSPQSQPAETGQPPQNPATDQRAAKSTKSTPPLAPGGVKK